MPELLRRDQTHIPKPKGLALRTVRVLCRDLRDAAEELAGLFALAGAVGLVIGLVELGTYASQGPGAARDAAFGLAAATGASIAAGWVRSAAKRARKETGRSLG